MYQILKLQAGLILEASLSLVSFRKSSFILSGTLAPTVIRWYHCHTEHVPHFILDHLVRRHCDDGALTKLTLCAILTTF